jgi:hypothetical protein
MKRVAAWILAVVVVGSPLAGASDYSDLWWKPDESGWGMSLVHQGDTAFVLLFVYGADGEARWYVASDARAVAYAGERPVFAGTLHRARGPWLGAPFDPSRVETAPVGSVSVEALSSGKVRVHYSAEGASGVKELVRLTWATPETEGFYLATFSLRQSLPNGVAYGVMAFAADASLRLEGPALWIRAEDALGRTCEYTGERLQAGRIAHAAGTFQCTPGAGGIAGSSGTFEIEDLQVTANGFTGYLRTVSPGTRQSGPFSGTRR